MQNIAKTGIVDSPHGKINFKVRLMRTTKEIIVFRFFHEQDRTGLRPSSIGNIEHIRSYGLDRTNHVCYFSIDVVSGTGPVNTALLSSGRSPVVLRTSQLTNVMLKAD